MRTKVPCCFLIATQANPKAPYVLLKSMEDADYICSISKELLMESMRNGALNLVNVTLAELESGVIKAPLEDYSEIYIDEEPLKLEHPYILWDLLDLLIKEGAKFRLPHISDRIFSFKDISFSMKTDEVSISYYEAGEKHTYILWSTPSLSAPSDCGAIYVKCSDSLKSKILGDSQAAKAVATATSYFSQDISEDFFLWNMSHMTCLWDTKYCLQRFHAAELAGLLTQLELHKATIAGYDIANTFLHNFEVRPEYLFSHVTGKSSNSSAMVSFVISNHFPDALQIASFIQSLGIQVWKLLEGRSKEESSHLLQTKILAEVPQVVDNCYLKPLCDSFVSKVSRDADMQEEVQQNLARLACRVFQYKMAYLNPVIRVPNSIVFTDGRLTICRGGSYAKL